MLILKAALFGFSSLGYWEVLRSKTETNVYFLPILTVAIQSCLLILGGLVNALGAAAWGVFFLGFALLGWMLWQEKGRNWRYYRSWGYGFFLVGILLTAIYLRSKVFTHNDNFTHWAIVVKRLLTSDRFPILTDTEIGFPYYPLGSSVYIYYFCKMIGRSEPMQMLAQSYMMLASFLALFACAKRSCAVAGAVLTCVVAMIFGYSIRINELLVDTLLPLVGMAAVLYVLVTFSRDETRPTPGRHAVWVLIPLLVWLAQIKNSGMLFSYLAVALLIFYPRWDMGQLWQKLAAAAAPAVGNFLWSSHCAGVFPQELQEKHAMTAGNYAETFAEKTTENMIWIAEKTVRFMLSREGVFWILVWLAMLGLLTFLLRSAMKKQYFWLLGSVAVMHVVYMAGMVGMYLFSMPIDEAMGLASIERYSRTLDIAVYYLITSYGFCLISKAERKAFAALAGGALMLLSVATVKEMPDSRPWMTLDHRISVERNIREYGIEANCSYYICIPDYDDHHYFKLVHNFLLGKMPVAQKITDAAQLEEARGYDYLINMDVDNPIIQTWIAENYPDQAGASVITDP